MIKWTASLALFIPLTLSAHPQTSFPVQEATIKSVQQAILTKKISCTELIYAYLDHIKKYNLASSSKPPINAFSEINPSVIEEANYLDKAFNKTGKLTGPLHCIPVILKDNINTYDTTTASGSYALLGSQPTYDAFIVARLRKAGAIILGKGGMDEFAWGLFGISSRNGRVGNPYDTTQNPGGSSSGSAAAVSANFAVIGIGTDNSGSIRIPAAFNGLTGLRPSTGLISQHGIFPMGNLDGVAGPLARNVTDLAIALTVIAQPDNQDPKTISAPREKSYLSFLSKDGLKNKRIGIVRQVNNIDTFSNMPADINLLINKSIQDMQKLGAVIIDDIRLPHFNNDRKLNQTGEMQDINDYLASFPAARRNFNDICTSTRTNTFGNAKACIKFANSLTERDSLDYQKTILKFNQNEVYLHKIMQDKHIDMLFIPISTHGSATYDVFAINSWRAAVASNSGLPSLAINIGYTANKMPVGIELIGNQYHEGDLIAAAYAYETTHGPRMTPALPQPDVTLTSLSIPQLNHLFTLLGVHAYEQILIRRKNEPLPDLLTPEKFQLITRKTIDNYFNGSKDHE